MSLAFYASPINDTENIMKRKQTHNKTQKRYQTDFDTEKVNNVLQNIHTNSKYESEDTLADFYPPPKPESAGVQKTIEHMENNQMFQTLGRAPEPSNESREQLDLNNFNSNYGDSKSAEEYYKKFIPNYTNHNKHRLDGTGQDILLQKLNYMIHLLEENQDEKTNNVTEEIVLYSFLGIFIIFIVDSFARVGKYVR